MTARYDYTGIFSENPTPRTMFGPPRNARASKKLMQTIEDAQREHDTPEAFADWLADFMEGYGARFAHPSVDLTEGADGMAPQCSFCGAPWGLSCGHEHLSEWKPVTGEEEEDA